MLLAHDTRPSAPALLAAAAAGVKAAGCVAVHCGAGLQHPGRTCRPACLAIETTADTYEHSQTVRGCLAPCRCPHALTQSIDSFHLCSAGLHTTPQLHWMLRRHNMGQPCSEADYYASLVEAFQQLTQGFDAKQPVLVLHQELIFGNASLGGSEDRCACQLLTCNLP